ncbi:MAG: HAMP domain-containing histidine kinase [Planctomycetes bacterium]|nr:HAMP domain-containing histidine kinase [Planctomycetota bacterium]
MMRWSAWRGLLYYVWPMLTPLLLAAAVFYFVREPLAYWRQGESVFDEQAIQEWVRESRVGSRSLPETIKDFLADAKTTSQELRTGKRSVDGLLDHHKKKRAEIQELLEALCLPTKIYPGQLPLFPVIHRLEVRFDDDVKNQHDDRLNFGPIAWDSDNPPLPHQFRDLGYELGRDEGVRIQIQFQLHAYMQKQFREREDDAKRRLVNIGVLVFVFIAIVWMVILRRREAAREFQRLQTEQQIQESRQKHLEEELRRQEAERKQEEAERKHLQEELRRREAEREKQEAERQALELKSQMFHSIGIMAKSYAHNIKNLLVRPNDLLRRCLEEHPSPEDETRMLLEIQQTLGTVTERLQEILQTVQRDPNKFESVRLDLNALAQDLHKTWAEQAQSKWKMVIDLDLHGRSAPLYVSGDRSHLQQTLENFLFNARDAISEMRNHLRKQARPDGAIGKGPLDETQRQALIAAAGWKGRVLIRTCVIDAHPVIELHDNGIGMTAETRAHCTEPHFSTKRNNALYAGLSAGMGLGLSFVQMILQHHGATLEIESEPLKGALFRVRFPAALAGPATTKAGQESVRQLGPG